MAITEHFLFNSDYSTNKIVYTLKNTTTITGYWRAQYECFNTHIKTWIYPEGDFKVEGSNEIAPMHDISTQSGVRGYAASFMYNGECWIVSQFFNFNQANVGKKVEYRIWAYIGENDGKNADVSPNSNVTGSKLIFTSDENYPKFIGDIFINAGDTYNHNLGYIPLVQAWSKQANNQITIPDIGEVTVDAFTISSHAFFGNTDYTSDVSDVFRVSANSIKTYPSSDSDRLGWYFRMFKL